MTRTDLDAHTLARSLRRMAGDGSVEWVMEPIQADVLRDVADALDENAELRELAWTLANCAAGRGCDYCPINGGYGYVDEKDMCESVHANMRELEIEV